MIPPFVQELDLTKLGITKNSYAIVASHGNYDEDMLVSICHPRAIGLLDHRTY